MRKEVCGGGVRSQLRGAQARATARGSDAQALSLPSRATAARPPRAGFQTGGTIVKAQAKLGRRGSGFGIPRLTSAVSSGLLRRPSLASLFTPRRSSACILEERTSPGRGGLADLERPGSEGRSEDASEPPLPGDSGDFPRSLGVSLANSVASSCAASCQYSSTPASLKSAASTPRSRAGEELVAAAAGASTVASLSEVGDVVVDLGVGGARRSSNGYVSPYGPSPVASPGGRNIRCGSNPVMTRRSRWDRMATVLPCSPTPALSRGRARPRATASCR